jgi:hypothetical protein
MSDNNKLSKYRAKRDFSKTVEPSGQTKITASNRRRFIIQKHAATRLHYDLRLELDAVFKSWAVTRSPSLDPAERRRGRDGFECKHDAWRRKIASGMAATLAPVIIRCSVQSP